MSLAKQLIGEPAPKVESVTPSTEQAKPIHAMDLIDSLAAQEFIREEGATSSSDAKHAFHDAGPEQHGTTGAGKSSSDAQKAFQKKKQKGAGGGYEAKGKSTPGQVAPAPGSVKYGKS